MKKKWLRLASFVLMIVLLFAGYYVYSMFSFLDTVNTHKPFSTGDNPLTTAKWEGTEQVNILFLGVDSRNSEEPPRSDTMLMLSIDPVSKNASLFSIMRDTYVDIPGVGESKINAAFANGGPELLIETLQQFLDQPIHYYAATDFEGFAKIVDAIGGVDVTVKEKMVHADDGVHDILLQPGEQHLDGKQALMYVRYRGTVRADFDRTERQREFAKIVGAKLASPGMALKLPKILKEVTPYTQSNLGANDLYKLIALGLKVDTGTMKTEQIPPVEHLSEEYVGDEQVLMPDVEGTREFVRQMISSTKGPETPQTGESDGNQQSPATGDSSQNGQVSQPTGENTTAFPQKQGGRQGTVEGEYVNLRQKPGTEFDVIGQVYAGETLTIEDQVGEWYYVQTAGGMYGYVKAALVQLNQ